MDIPRHNSARQKWIQRSGITAVILLAISAITLGLGRLKPAAPEVERAGVWIGEVKRGAMLRQVRGLGTLVPEEILWIPAATDGRVERTLVKPGARVLRDGGAGFGAEHARLLRKRRG